MRQAPRQVEVLGDGLPAALGIRGAGTAVDPNAASAPAVIDAICDC